MCNNLCGDESRIKVVATPIGYILAGQRLMRELKAKQEKLDRRRMLKIKSLLYILFLVARNYFRSWSTQ